MIIIHNDKPELTTNEYTTFKSKKFQLIQMEPS